VRKKELLQPAGGRKKLEKGNLNVKKKGRSKTFPRRKKNFEEAPSRGAKGGEKPNIFLGKRRRTRGLQNRKKGKDWSLH